MAKEATKRRRRRKTTAKPAGAVTAAHGGSERVKFTANYDHTWPSGAMTNYPSNYEGRVKAEVAERAVGLGKARRVGTASTATTPPVGPEGGKLDGGQVAEKLPGNLDPALAVPPALTPNLSNEADSE